MKSEKTGMAGSGKGKGAGKASAGKMASRLECAILVGGLGTRLRPLTYDIPKPLVQVNGKPFLGYLLERVADMGIRKVTLLTGYKGGMVEDYCGNGSAWGLDISYSREPKPLGTGGALLKASRQVESDCLVLNGDTYLDINLGEAERAHRESKALATIVCMEGSLKDRGAVVVGQGGHVKSFLEKQHGGEDLFNTGAFIISQKGMEQLAKIAEGKGLGEAFSTEMDIFPELVKLAGLYAVVAKGKFLDMGTFESLAKAGEIIS
ncbi:MAG TPA: sugar phosphate nucleotidyltransferase [Candidatus Micrarchaeota archaeon]|nr:sugar phosphate nucleotidyltransferase [Candidatus Micrarchaeota archaeon]